MNRAYRVSPAADRDIDNQAGFLERVAGLETSIRFYDATDRTFRELVQMPGMGEPVASARPKVRGIRVRTVDGFPNHLVFYRPTADGIEVVRVLHGARDVDRIVESEQV